MTSRNLPVEEGPAKGGRHAEWNRGAGGFAGVPGLHLGFGVVRLALLRLAAGALATPQRRHTPLRRGLLPDDLAPVEAEVRAQRRAGILVPVQPAPLQLRH